MTESAATSEEREARRWSDIGPMPNSRIVMRWRHQRVRAAQAPPVKNRVEYLVGLCRGRRTLDIGCVDQADPSRPAWLHAHVVKAASYCLGIDIQPLGVRALQEAGYNVRFLDIMRDPVDEQFDVVIAGEVVAQLSDPGALFAAAQRVLVPGGRLVVTTPNPYYINHVRHHWRGGGYECADIVTHMFPSGIAELAEREGLRLDRWLGIQVEDLPQFGKSASLGLVKWSRGVLRCFGITAEAFCPTLAFELVPIDNNA